MKKFQVKFVREFEVGIEAVDTPTAEALARQVLAQFPKDTVKILSIIAEDAVVYTSEDPEPTKPWGRPNGGGSPGTPTVKVPELVDQVAKAA